ncbi:putative superfamily III holin-X [Novosphingobium kunmingense]|uniref:Putative superfamily III holin-X n=1 Tax=Novosphingobium kunmingense TaxID=1211806 RepID=A0A2N0I241_9SPHN|nr:phage holin family protein [Novosphingobium kunmingense]PKB25256.1 putative superfamily III holin-X [Novosphingobium kunmingense]
MADETNRESLPSTSDAAERSLVDDVRALVEDGKTLVEAELAYQKSRAAVAGAGAKGVASWGALALALVFFALMAVVIGTLLGLSTVIGPWAATAAVTAALALAAAFCAMIAARRWKHTARLLSDAEDAA